MLKIEKTNMLIILFIYFLLIYLSMSNLFIDEMKKILHIKCVGSSYITWHMLPISISELIFGFLSLHELCKINHVSKSWNLSRAKWPSQSLVLHEIIDPKCITALINKSVISILMKLQLHNVTSNDLSIIKKLKYLHHLDLTESPLFANDGLQHISALTQLRTLDLSGNPAITDNGLQHISTLTQLQTLGFRYLNITGDGLKYLTTLKQLHKLDLTWSINITDNSLIYISRLKQLCELNLRACYEITDEGLKHISALKQLHTLDISACTEITNKGIEHLSILRHLKQLTHTWCRKITKNCSQFITAKNNSSIGSANNIY